MLWISLAIALDRRFYGIPFPGSLLVSGDGYLLDSYLIGCTSSKWRLQTSSLDGTVMLTERIRIQMG